MSRPSAWSQKTDQLYVSKDEVDAKGRAYLIKLEKLSVKAYVNVSKQFEAAVSKKFGPKFLKRLRNVAARRQMSCRQYSRAVLAKPQGKK